MINKLNLIAKFLGFSLVFLVAQSLSAQCTGGQVPSSCNATGEFGPNMIINPSFEAGGVTGWLFSGCGQPNQGDPFLAPCGFIIRDGWSTFNAGVIRDNTDPFTPCNPQNEQPSAFTGNNYLKMWQGGGTFLANEIVNNGGPVNWPLVTPGRTYGASVRMMSPSDRAEGCDEDHLSGGLTAVIRIEYWLGDNTLCQLVESEPFDETYANGGWYTFSVQGIAPPGAVRANVIMVMVGAGGGAVYFDDVTFAEKLDGAPAGTPVTLACNDNVNVTVNGSCGLEIDPSSLLEGANEAIGFDLVVRDLAGNPINIDDVSSHIGSHNQTFEYQVIDQCSGNYCWGTLTLEDKSDPVVECSDCTDPTVSDPGCIFNCTEEKLFSTFIPEEDRFGFDPGLLDDILPTDIDDFVDDFVSDNCGVPVTANYRDVFSSVGDCSEGTLMTRIWTVNFPSVSGGVTTVTCERYYKFLPISNFDEAGTFVGQEAPFTEIAGICVPTIDETITGQILMPKAVVEIPTCNVAIDPVSLQAFFDSPLSEDDDTDDDGIDPDEGDVDCVIEANEGTWVAYPHYYIAGLNESHLYGNFIEVRGVPHAQALNPDVCNTVVEYSDTPLEACAPGCGGNTKTLRTWRILDWCASSFAEYQQVIHVVDRSGPSLGAAPVLASVDPWECNADVLIPAPSLSDACDQNLTYEIGFVEGALEVTGNATDGFVIHNVPIGTTEFQYVSSDCCGNIGQFTSSITVEDNTAPVPVTIENIVIELARLGGDPVAQGVDQGTAKISVEDIDNGSFDSCTDVVVEIRRSAVCNDADAEWGEVVTFCCSDLGGAQSTQVVVDLRVCDKNGNCNFLDAVITLEDKAAGGPGSCPADVVLQCTDDIWDFDLTGLPGNSFSTCEEIVTELDSATLAEILENTEPRTKRFNQGGPSLGQYFGVEVPAFDPDCGFGAFRREIDGCPDQWIVVEPQNPTTFNPETEIWEFDSAFDPTTIVWPEDATVDCDGYDGGVPTWVDTECQLVGSDVVTEVITIEEGGGAGCLTILNHWTIVDFCKYDPSRPDEFIYRWTQTIKIIDTEAPTVTSETDLCFAVNTEECDRKGVTLSAVGVDEGECSSAWISWTINVDYNADWVIDEVFTSNVAPVLPSGEPNPFYVAKTASGDAVSINLAPNLAKDSGHRIEWNVSDGCGNRGTFTSTFTVEDKKAPTPYCLNLGTAVMSNGEVELWAVDFNIGSFDNCSPQEALFYTFTDVAPPPRCDEEYDSQTNLMWYDASFWFYESNEGTVDDDDDCPLNGEGAYSDGGFNPDTGAFEEYGGDIHRWFPGLRSSGAIFTTADVSASGFLQLPVYVWDECGQLDFCLVELRVIDNGGGARVSGRVATEDGREVEDVMTELKTIAPEFSKFDMTDESGTYAFDDNALTQDYEVSGEKNDDYLNGVSTIDLVKVQRHILGLEPFETAGQMIAADVNNDQRINGQDLVELRKLILGIYSELPQNDSWKIINAKDASTLTLANPWNYGETITIAEMAEDMFDQDFIGVKIGDVNHSVVANRAQGLPSTDRGVSLEFTDGKVEAGEEVTVTMTTTEQMYGYQFTMDMSAVSLVEVTGQSVTEGNVAVLGAAMTMSTSSVEAMTGELFTLKLKATESGQLSELLGMNSSVTKAEAYLGENLETVSLNLSGAKEVEFSLGQNEPNPFKETTTIGYSLPEASDIKLTLYDVTGKVLQVIRDQGQQGENKVIVSTDALTTGVVYYKLETGEYTATRHMIVIE